MDISTIINGIKFKKSSFSEPRRCVGVAYEDERILVTNTQTKQAIVEFTIEEWKAFLKGVKNGEFEIESLRS